MKKNIVICSLVFLLVLTVIVLLHGSLKKAKENDLSSNYITFIAKVVEKNGKNYIVMPNSDEDIYKSSDKISITADYDYEINDMIKVTCKSEIMESYPARVSTIKTEAYLINNTKTKYKDIKELDKSYTMEQAALDGYFTLSARAFNDHLYFEFTKYIEKKIPSTIRLFTSLEDTAMIINEVSYKGDGKIHIICNSNKNDNDLSNNFNEYTFDNISIYKNKQGEFVYAYNGDYMNEEKINTKDSYLICVVN